MDFTNLIIFTFFVIPFIITPGPGVLLTINSTALYGMKNNLITIFSLAFGIFLVSNLTLLLNTFLLNNEYILIIIKIIGILFLTHLTVETYELSKQIHYDQKIKKINNIKKIQKAFLTSITNPKVYIVWLIVIPTFTKHNNILLNNNGFIYTLVFVLLFVIVHLIYSYIFNSILSTVTLECKELIIKKLIKYSSYIFFIFTIYLTVDFIIYYSIEYMINTILKVFFWI